MTTVFKGVTGLVQTRAYLEDDRIEVGRITFAYTEDLTRVAYRDVVAVTFASAANNRWRFSGLGFALAAVGITAVLVASSVPALTVVLVAVGLGLCGAAGFWFGRKGTATAFRVDGVRNHVTGCVGGRAAKRERFKLELLTRIEDAKRRAAAASAEAGSAQAASTAFPRAASSQTDSSSPASAQAASGTSDAWPEPGPGLPSGAPESPPSEPPPPPSA